MAAAYNGHHDIIKLLIEVGADIHVKSNDVSDYPMSLFNLFCYYNSDTVYFRVIRH